MFTLSELESVLPLVRAIVPPTLQYAWPLLKARTGVEVVVKHENHTSIGAFKVRGGIVYFNRLKRDRPQVQGIVTATRGNHGQSLAFAGARAGIAVTIVVPRGNSIEKNAAMRSLGAELIEYGRDFDEAKEHAVQIAAQRGDEYAPSFHRDFVVGVATYAHELFTAVDELDTVYVPIGLGSGICGVIGTRDVLGRKTRIVGVVAEADFPRTSLRNSYRGIIAARAQGLMIGIEFGPPQSMKLKASWRALEAAKEGLFCQVITMPLFKEHKILSQVAGHAGHTIKLLPSLVISGADCEWIVSAFDSVLTDSERVPGAIWSLGKAFVGHTIRASA